MPPIYQVDLTGCSFYKYVHPCDQEELAKQLGGQVPLEDMEIFDGLFCSDLPSVLKQNGRKPVCRKFHSETDAYRSFFIRMKSTLTSRGKSVNLSASIYRVRSIFFDLSLQRKFFFEAFFIMRPKFVL